MKMGLNCIWRWRLNSKLVLVLSLGLAGVASAQAPPNSVPANSGTINGAVTVTPSLVLPYRLPPAKLAQA